MKRTITGRFAIYIALTCMIGLMAESCKSGKHCGCGTDLGSVYKPKKRYRY